MSGEKPEVIQFYSLLNPDFIVTDFNDFKNQRKEHFFNFTPKD